MEPIVEVLPQLALYQPSLFVLTMLCLIVLIQGFLAAPLAFVKEEQMPGLPLRGDHSLLSFRVLRTHANSVESLAPYGLVLLVAVLLNVSPNLVNWVSGIFLVSRLAFWAIYYSGMGKVAGGPRTISFVVGMIANFVLVIACVVNIAR